MPNVELINAKHSLLIDLMSKHFRWSSMATIIIIQNRIQNLANIQTYNRS